MDTLTGVLNLSKLKAVEQMDGRIEVKIEKGEARPKLMNVFAPVPPEAILSRQFPRSEGLIELGLNANGADRNRVQPPV